MAGWRATARSIGLTVEGVLAYAFDYLETNGLRFCVDFGTENAIQKATDHWCGLKRRS
jgi:hypothetical protein